MRRGGSVDRGWGLGVEEMRVSDGYGHRTRMRSSAMSVGYDLCELAKDEDEDEEDKGRETVNSFPCIASKCNLIDSISIRRGGTPGSVLRNKEKRGME